MKKSLILTLLLLFLASINNLQAGSAETSPITIVPKPVSVKMMTGSFTINEQTPILISSTDNDLQNIAVYFSELLKFSGGPFLQIRILTKEDKNIPAIVLSCTSGSKIPNEGYNLKVMKHRILIESSSGSGLFYGIQSLLQLLPEEVLKFSEPLTGKKFEIPCLEIKDYPRYPYRGMHLDVSRHFFPKEFIKRYIDLIAMYKMNTFHWHLTDDNGWRIEIKKYPKLTEVGAWRVDRENLPWDKRPSQKPGEKATYGGFYTQDDIREIVHYASRRFIEVIPEIEMPAHSVEVLAAYPELSCTGGPFSVPPGSYWPNSDIYCAGNDSVFTFLQDVLTEVMDLFPSRYIHVGGDEADKTNWKKCPKCQARIAGEGLKDEKELQSYFIKRIEKFIVSKGRKLIGWDEILEGGLAPEATVMSWRGVDGGIEAAQQGHPVIMTPTSYCYFDYYQADPDFEPRATGAPVTLKKVYSFEPTPPELTPEQQKFIIGAQGNLWAEFIPSIAQAEYMAIPRMIALAEVVWSPKKERNWDDFRMRLKKQFARLDMLHVNYCKGSYKAGVSTMFDPNTHTMKVVLSSEQPDIPIVYTLNGDDPEPTSAVYTRPFEVSGNCYIKAGLFVDGKLKEKFTGMPFIFHNALGKKVTYLSEYSYRYPASGKITLIDGLRSGSSYHRDGYWQGFSGNDLEVIIDLGKEMLVTSVQMNFLHNQKSWIFLPELVEYSLSSDRKKYHSINEVLNKIPLQTEQVLIRPFNFQFREGTTARYVKIKAKNIGRCPSWHEGAGQPCWIFTDEIVVY